MKRYALFVGLALAAAPSAEAQLTMQMGNGWNFTFAGNVNAFYTYGRTQTQPTNAAGAAVGNTVDADYSGVGTGLLPAFATFAAKGKEGNTDLGVHFGFAPQVSAGNNVASMFGAQAAGAQIDMRQVFATIGGEWGTILAGKELGLFQRGNLVNDMTLFGVGPTGGFRGTGLGRIGYGYLYTDFRGQFTYSTAAGKPGQFSIGIFEPIAVGNFTSMQLPRVEFEATYGGKAGENGKYNVYVSGAAQTAKTAASGGTSLTSAGIAGGFKADFSGFSIGAAGFYANGMGSLFMGNLGGQTVANDPAVGGTFLGNNNARTSFGYYGQVGYQPKDSKVSFGISYGSNQVDLATGENNQNQLKKRTSITGLITYQVTKSYRFVFDGTYFDNKNQAGTTTLKGYQGSAGIMLFY
ncbi:MAG: hypothetical protein NW201_02805 [Gemmatimonadales bacterium]|nr:hypothetical protein [Gemmatimonadales bacterium]